jgi:hypothetical protein
LNCIARWKIGYTVTSLSINSLVGTNRQHAGISPPGLSRHGMATANSTSDVGETALFIRRYPAEPDLRLYIPHSALDRARPEGPRATAPLLK